MLTYEQRQKLYKKRARQIIHIKIIIGAVAVLLMLFGMFFFAVASSEYTLEPAKFIKAGYFGFEGKGTVSVSVDREALLSELGFAYAKYETNLWPFDKKMTNQDFLSFADTFTVSDNAAVNLKNGDEYTISVGYDREASKGLYIDIPYDSVNMTVEGLSEGIMLTEDEVFASMDISANGISPVVTLEVTNTSEEPFLKKINYEITEPKDFYSDGDLVEIAAKYDPVEAVAAHYELPENPVFSYRVESDRKLITSTAEFTKEAFVQAVEEGKKLFVNANDYGLRIFTEAGLVYTWVGTGNYTFKWSNPSLISAYVETLKEDKYGDSTKLFNYLELVYKVHISQADGTGCDAEAVVCFDGMTVDKDGNVDINADSGQLFSASHNDRSIKSSLRGWFGDDYNLERFVIEDYLDSEETVQP